MGYEMNIKTPSYMETGELNFLSHTADIENGYSSETNAAARYSQTARNIVRQIVSQTYDEMRMAFIADDGLLSEESLASLQSKSNERAKQLAAALAMNDNTAKDEDHAFIGNERRQPGYRRFAVEQLHHLFAAGEIGGQSFSRRMLPGIFLGIDLILGPKLRSEFDIRANEIRENGIYADDSVEMLNLDLLVELARTFVPFKRRSSWFIKMINGHLSKADKVGPDDRSEIDLAGLKILLQSLFADLRTALRSKSKQSEMVERYGQDAVTEIEIVFEELWA